MDKTAIVIVIIVAVIAAGFWAWQSGVLAKIFSPPSAEPVVIPEGINLFYGEGCLHCKVVDDFIEQNNIKDKISFSNLEVWYNKNNQNILAQVVQKCNITTDQVGVPFLYDGQSCIIGDQPIIDFFKEKTGIQ